MLLYPDALREKDGLRLAAALREGREGVLRKALADASPADAAAEWVVLDTALTTLGPATTRPERGGRPTIKARTATDLTFRSGQDADGWYIRVQGPQIDQATMDGALRELQRILKSR